MRITSLKVRDFRSFVDMAPIEFESVNVVLGPNNAGKSSLLRAIYTIQGGMPPLNAEVRLGAPGSQIDFGLTDFRAASVWGDLSALNVANLTAKITSGGDLNLELRTSPNAYRAVRPLPPREPGHVVVPYFAKRKAVGYAEDVCEDHALSVTPLPTQWRQRRALATSGRGVLRRRRCSMRCARGSTRIPRAAESRSSAPRHP